MSQETQHLLSPERTVPQQYEFMSVDNMTAYRAAELEAQTAAREAAVANVSTGRITAMANADEQLKNDRVNRAEAYVAEHMDRDNDPALFDRFVSLISAHSFHVVDNRTWRFGDQSANGDFDQPETAGQRRYTAALIDMVGEQPAAEDPELVTLSEALSTTRMNLAKLSVERRRRTHNKFGKRAKLEEKFDLLNEEYKAAYQAVAAKRLIRYREAGLNDQLLQQGAVAAVISELGAFNAAEREVLESDTSARGRFAQFLARSNRRMFAGSVVSGAAFGLASREAINHTVRGLLVAATGGLAVGAMAATGALRGLLVSVSKTRSEQLLLHEERANEDKKYLGELMETVPFAVDPHQTFIGKSVMLHEVIADRVYEDQRFNRRYIVKGGVYGAVGGVIGFGVGEGLHHAPAAFQAAKHAVASWLGKPDVPNTGLKGTENSDTSNSGSGNGGHHQGHRPGHVNGFKTNVTVENGHGYTHELQDLAEQKGIHLSGTESYAAYQHLHEQFGNRLLTNDASYNMGNGNIGISHPGDAHWNHQAVHEFQRWLEENDKTKTGKSKFTLAA